MPAAEIRPGQIIELSIDNVAHGGRFVGRHGAVANDFFTSTTCARTVSPGMVSGTNTTRPRWA